MIVAEDFARMAEDSGAKAVTIHARTWTDGFSGETDWGVIAAVKKAVTIPVIGNGGILCHRDGIDMVAETGCDGVMSGRAAVGNPWICQPNGSSPSLSRRLESLARHLELIRQFHPAERILAKTKNHAGKYFKGHPGVASVRRRIYDAKTFDELCELVDSLRSKYA
jgi:tRNA-dihydrouridine synthase